MILPIKNLKARNFHPSSKLLGVIIVFFFAALFFILPTRAEAGTLYLAPASRSVNNATDFSFEVRENSGSDEVNAVEALLTYPADKMDFVSINNAGSAFAIEAPSSGGGGNVTISRANISSLTGDKLVATVNFKSKVGSGSGAITFKNESAVVRSSDQANVATTKTGATVTFTTPSSPPPSTPTTPTTPKPTTPTTPSTPTVDQAAPKLVGSVSTQDVTGSTATIVWKTDEAASSVVEWGFTTTYALVAKTDGSTTDHAVKLDTNFLIAGQTYHYRVKSTDAAGNEFISEDFTFTTAGGTQPTTPTSGAGEEEEAVTLADFLDRRILLGVIIFLVLLEVFLVIKYRHRIRFFNKPNNNPPI